MANSDLYFTCEICIEPVNINKKFKHNNGNCKDNFCTDCICKYVEANMVQSNNANIKCPVLGCRLPLNPLSCRPILPTHLFDKWCELLCGQTVLQKYELSQRCYCPYPDCSALVLNECGDNPTESTCPNCKRQICFQCKSPWHPGKPCNKNNSGKSRNDILVQKLIKKNKWTRCPCCGHAVQRISGCSTIRCRCGHRFCHVCGAGESISCNQYKHNEGSILLAFFLAIILLAVLLFFLL